MLLANLFRSCIAKIKGRLAVVPEIRNGDCNYVKGTDRSYIAKIKGKEVVVPRINNRIYSDSTYD